MKINEKGRSMIEMLGVLAIIAVLTVGGIAGYSKAMHKYKMNKSIQQITDIVFNIRSLFANERDYKGVNSIFLKNPDLISEGMVIDSDMPVLRNALNHVIAVYSGGGYSLRDEGDYGSFAIYIHDINNKRECVELVTRDWGTVSSGLVFVAVVNNPSGDIDIIEGDVYLGCHGGKQGQSVIACAGGDIIPTPMPLHIAAEACTDKSEIAIKFY
ncbi:MAG: hypothetical protein Q4D80_05650 [Pseudomonadota bacterium]|nr:hypothetical protein [Pseudomonadota bacterium]